uniref:Actin-related protein 2/3 complex subunit 5 n=1 Tax=Arcella intermedia TaxID=1963864 RepID=A0A6B2LSX4_9EUKA
MKASLVNPPYGCTDTGLKNQNLTNIASVLKGIKKEADVDKAVEGLSLEELDVLTKYIYAALSREDPDSKLLFYWHSATLKKAGGLGSVIRVLADKSNTVL